MTEAARDYGLEAQKAAEQHLDALGEAEEREENGEQDVQWPESAGPWCGCGTCTVRETLWAAWPILLEQAREQAGVPAGAS